MSRRFVFMKKVLFIVNPISGGKSKRKILRLIEAFASGSGIETTIRQTEAAGHDPILAKESDADPRVLYRKLKAEGKPLPQIYMACGTEDFLLTPNRAMRDFFAAEGADLRYEEGPGIHDWNFWSPRSLEGVEWLLKH